MWVNGCIFAFGGRNDILHSALLSAIRNRNRRGILGAFGSYKLFCSTSVLALPGDLFTSFRMDG